MVASVKRFFPQPAVALAVAVLAGAGLGGAWLMQAPLMTQAATILEIIFLIVALVASYQFPIHLGFRHKVYLNTVPLFITAVLLPNVPLAATTAAAGILAGELAVRTRLGLYYSDITTSVGRLTVVVLAGSVVAHLPVLASLPGDAKAICWVVAAVVMWAGQLITFPLLICPVTGQRPWRVIITSVYEAGPAEGAQYLLGLLGALAADQQPWALLLLALPTAFVYMAFKSVKEMHTSTREMLERMADTVDLRDPYTGGHSRRVAEFTATILKEMKVVGPEADLIVSAARIHDIGKIGVPDHILNKNGKLTPEEKAIMDSHAEQGAELVMRYPDFERGAAIVRHHHESWDGTGYPHRLKSTEIPFGARVIAVADSYDAMTSTRPYRQAMALEKAAMILRQGRGQQWDAAIVDAFLRTIADQLAERPVTAPPVLQLVPSKQAHSA